MANPRTIVFDLDGTLLDTLADLSAAVNHALRLHAMPERSVREVRDFVGNGVRRLMERAVPEGTPEAVFENVFAAFRTYYAAHCLDQTRPYPGILPLLQQLKARGCRMAIVSNKLQPAVTELNHRFFKDFITTAIGESATVRRKPCPDAVLAALHAMGSRPGEAVYVGDSEVDIETARRAGVDCVTVLWGFRDEEFLRESGAQRCIKQPEELLALV